MEEPCSREGRAGSLCVESSEYECGEVGKREVRTYLDYRTALFLYSNVIELSCEDLIMVLEGHWCHTPPEQKSPAHCGAFVLMSARNTFLSKSFLSKIEYTLQIVELHVQISTLGSSALVIGNLPRCFCCDKVARLHSRIAVVRLECRTLPVLLHWHWEANKGLVLERKLP
ncbi:hypothetical protein AV530_000829 [Patagioenas fasciata monilis]|uniref:Uncharacterized protein n=1 Tax=Patagioenas fasciata monilis TaxID=372326 RepID=A0A1V4KSD0_PATFA|nr:hypothetical protein AV530_000829 [Patagioenas fasciata monilis]